MKRLSGIAAANIRWLLTLNGLALLGMQFMLWSKLPFDVLRFGALCSIVLLFSLWSRRESLRLESGLVPTIAGLLLIGFVLVESVSSAGSLFASLAPLVSGLGMALLASGGVRQYWKEFALLVLLQAPFLLHLLVFDLLGWDPSPATAAAAAGLARILGCQAVARDVYVATPGGLLAVFEGCSGIRSMFFLLGLAITLLALFPPRARWGKLAALPAGIAIAFGINACRVALLIILVSESRHEAFEYWHLGNGALLFESASVFAFVLFYHFIILHETHSA